MDKHLLSSIYDIKGDKKKVVRICRAILSSDGDDTRAEETLRRIATKRINISGLNTDMYDAFMRADSNEKLIAFERWLVGY